MSEIQKNIIKIILIFCFGSFICSYIILIANSDYMYNRSWQESLIPALTDSTNLKVVLCAFAGSLIWSLPILYFQRLKIGWLFSIIFMLPIIFSIETLYLYFWPPQWEMPLHRSLMLSLYSTWKYILPVYILCVIIPFWPTKRKNPRTLSGQERSGILVLFMTFAFLLMGFFAHSYIVGFILLPVLILALSQKLYK
ncbi:MAG: hypothetical protein VX278_17240 [Myxococcota bacterium]|nr:hypothetical protein [Myxococcota bacterium]